MASSDDSAGILSFMVIVPQGFKNYYLVERFRNSEFRSMFGTVFIASDLVLNLIVPLLPLYVSFLKLDLPRAFDNAFVWTVTVTVALLLMNTVYSLVYCYCSNDKSRGVVTDQGVTRYWDPDRTPLSMLNKLGVVLLSLFQAVTPVVCLLMHSSSSD